MKRKKQLAFGFNFNKEYSEYKKLCRVKNTSYTYADWYRRIKEKYECYDSEKLYNLEKYLSWYTRRKQKQMERLEFFSKICSYVISILLPIVAIICSLVTYFDSLQCGLVEIELVANQNDLQMMVEQYKYRLDMFSKMLILFKFAGFLSISYVLVMLLFYIFISGDKEKTNFLLDYNECIVKIKEEKLEKSKL